MKTLSSFTHPRHSKPIRILYIFKTQIMTILKKYISRDFCPSTEAQLNSNYHIFDHIPLFSLKAWFYFLNQPHLACLQVYKWGFNAAFNLLKIWCLIPLSAVKDACGCILVTYLLGHWCSSHLCVFQIHICTVSTPHQSLINKTKAVTLL